MRCTGCLFMRHKRDALPDTAAAAAVPAVIELEEEMIRRPGYTIVRSKWSYASMFSAPSHVLLVHLKRC